jgi:hypothetical protein
LLSRKIAVLSRRAAAPERFALCKVLRDRKRQRYVQFFVRTAEGYVLDGGVERSVRKIWNGALLACVSLVHQGNQVWTIRADSQAHIARELAVATTLLKR